MNSKTPPRLAPGLLVLLLTLAGPAPAAAAAAPTGQERAEAAGKGLIGSPAPRTVIETIDGQRIDLGSLYGKKAVYLKFWATWCVPCREQMPHFERTFESAGPDLAVIAINVGFNDSLAQVQDYRRKLGIKMPIVIDDGSLGEAFNLRVTPQHVIIGRDGRIQYVSHLASERLEAALVAARTSSGGAATPAESVIGAGPKYSVGDKLPALAVRTLDGKQFALQTGAGKQRTVLVFMSPWCESYLATSRPGLAADCRAAREKVAALAGRKGVRWLGVASGLWATAADLEAYRDKHKIPIALTLDESGNLFREFRVMTVPTIVVVDENGKIIRRLEGHAADPQRALEGAAGTTASS